MSTWDDMDSDMSDLARVGGVEAKGVLLLLPSGLR
jgi:hypothetical protein